MFSHRGGSGEEDKVSEYTQRTGTINVGLPKNNSETCLTIQVPNLYPTTSEVRKSHSSPVHNLNQRRRYSQGAVLVMPQYSMSTGELGNTSAFPTPWSCEADLFRHSSDNLKDLPSDSNFASTIDLLTVNHEPGCRDSESRRKTSWTGQERLSKPSKRHWPDDHLTPLDDICESPLVKTPNEPVQWSTAATEHSMLSQHSSTANTLFALDLVSASLQNDKGLVSP